jgi:hypothetical protein
MSLRRSPYARPEEPPNDIRLTDRDWQILETIHAFDGMMSLNQIDRLFFSGEGRSQPRARMRALYCNYFVNMPQAEDIHKVPLGETIFWLDTQGAQSVAMLHGEAPSEFKWRSKPRWSLIAHDLKVNDFRIDIMTACEVSPELTLHQWIPEGEFWAYPDTITYVDQNGKSQSRQVRPDGYFTIRRPAASHPGKQEEFAFLLEIDMATEDNPRFGREKVLPGIAYLKSDAYQERFGLRFGRWLVVTTGRRRMNNMRSQTKRLGGKNLFYFTTFDQVTPETILTHPIWLLSDRDSPASIIPQPYC